VAHRPRMTNEAFDAAKRLRESEVPSPFENPRRRFGNAFKKKGDHPAATAHLTRRKDCDGDGSADPGIVHPRPSGVVQETATSSAFAACFSMRSGRVLRTRNSGKLLNWSSTPPRRVMQETQAVYELAVIANDRGAADDIRVSAHLFGHGMNNDVEAKLERPLHRRRGERVVSNRQDPPLATDASDSGEIGDTK
jgi:hypothetical protein